MQLESLDVSLDKYGEHKGKYVGRAKFASSYGSVEVVLSPQVSTEVLKLCADALVANAKDMAQNMTAEVITQAALPAPSPEPA